MSRNPLGRFLSPDPAGLYFADPSNPQSLNLYSYVRNNPLINTDPTGQECVWDDGSYDSTDDPRTGNEGNCGVDGGTYVDPNLFENSLLTNGKNANVQYGSWSGQADSTVAASFTNASSTTSSGPGMPLLGSFGPQEVGVQTQDQMTAMLVASHFIYSPADTALSKLTKAHPGPNFRSSTGTCSVHANILPGTGVNGVPATADFHVDLVNPLLPGTPIPEPENAAAHGVIDVIPDFLQGRGAPVPTGNQLCK